MDVLNIRWPYDSIIYFMIQSHLLTNCRKSGLQPDFDAEWFSAPLEVEPSSRWTPLEIRGVISSISITSSAGSSASESKANDMNSVKPRTMDAGIRDITRGQKVLVRRNLCVVYCFVLEGSFLKRFSHIHHRDLNIPLARLPLD